MAHPQEISAAAALVALVPLPGSPLLLCAV